MAKSNKGLADCIPEIELVRVTPPKSLLLQDGPPYVGVEGEVSVLARHLVLWSVRTRLGLRTAPMLVSEQWRQTVSGAEMESGSW